MKKIHYGLIVLAMLLSLATSAVAGVSIGIGFPNVSIGINLPLFPQLVPVPGYPVYYAPEIDANYFFYDGMYWVYEDDNWYASAWYNGPWDYVEPVIVPLFVLRIPVAYYRNRPAYFRGWQSNAPPRWGQYWGRDWEEHRRGWDRWERRSVPPRAPRPTYQRSYSGDQYPRGEQQQSLHNRNYRYQPRDQAVRQHLTTRQKEQRAPAPAQRGQQDVTPQRSPKQQNVQRPTYQKSEPSGQRAQPQHQAPPQQRGAVVPEQRQSSQEQGRRAQESGKAQESKRGKTQGQGQGQEKDEERGRGRNN